MKLFLLVVFCVPLTSAPFNKSVKDEACLIDYLEGKGYVLEKNAGETKLLEYECTNVIGQVMRQNLRKISTKIRTNALGSRRRVCSSVD